jgi:nitronate monooxygenase
MAGGFTTPALVNAVTAAGACGSFGFAYTEPSEILRQSAEVKSGAFSINLFLHEHKPYADEQARLTKMLATLKPLLERYNLPLLPNIAPKISLSHQFEAVLKAKPTIFSSTLNAPSKEMVKACKAAKILVCGTATSLEEALFLEERGVDLITLQGREAGGHRGTFLHEFQTHDIGIFALLETCAVKVKTPLVAAGGIMSGRGIKAALTLGATAVQMGTAFMTCKEAGTHPAHRKMLLESYNETVLTKAYTGRPARGIKNEMYQFLVATAENTPSFDTMNALTRDIRGAASKENNAEFMSLWAGEAYRACREMSVSDFINTLMHEFKG